MYAYCTVCRTMSYCLSSLIFAARPARRWTDSTLLLLLNSLKTGKTISLHPSWKPLAPPKKQHIDLFLLTMVWLSRTITATSTATRGRILSCSYRPSSIVKNNPTCYAYAPWTTTNKFFRLGGVGGGCQKNDSSAGATTANFHYCHPSLLVAPQRQYYGSSASTLSPAGDSSSSSSPSSIRLSKLLSKYTSNLTLSRREAERLIRQGQVTIAGKIVDTPHLLVEWKDITAPVGGAANTKTTGLSNSAIFIKVQGKAAQIIPPGYVITNNDNRNDVNQALTAPHKADKPKVWIVHKLGGEVVTERDPLNRPSLLERLKRGGVGYGSNSNGGKKIRYHLKPIGRLDVPTEGLLLLTNDGDYAREMELPKSKIHRTYRVRVHGKLTPYKLDCIRRGTVYYENTRYGPMSVFMERKRTGSRSATSTNTWLRVTCTEGKNRQIRNVFQALGVTVTRLIRISYGDYELQTIPPGMAVEVPCKPVAKQRNKGSLIRRTKPRQIKPIEEVSDASPVQWVTYKQNF